MVLQRLRREYRDNPILLESFLVVLLVAALVVAGEFAVFAIQGWMGAQGIPFHSPHTRLDDYIPFVPVMIWPYWFYFAFMAMGAWLPRNRYDLARLAVGFLLMNFLSYAFFLAYPTVMERPSLEGCMSISCGMVGVMYDMDPGYGLLPSLHTANSVFIALCAFVFQSRLRWIAAGIALSILASTVMVKQHYIVDVPAGILVGSTGAFFSVYLLDRLAARNKLLATMKGELLGEKA